jgi:predicted  nucleic acid-binding Zn-ribbon protein
MSGYGDSEELQNRLHALETHVKQLQEQVAGLDENMARGRDTLIALRDAFVDHLRDLMDAVRRIKETLK